ncbi:MAG: phage integrase N-terminal SAM-like domain-containing protein [Pseudomonadota bacterium]
MQFSIFFHGKRHPSELGKPHLGAFLNHLASERKVSASTRSQTPNALYQNYPYTNRSLLQRYEIRITLRNRS